jgi:hypothetical protein
MIPKMGCDQPGWFIDTTHDGGVTPWAKDDDDEDCNIFPTKEMAQGYAAAFHFMLNIRMQEGSGVKDIDGNGYMCYTHQAGEMLGHDLQFIFTNTEDYSLTPPFPTEKLLEKAIENCGGKEHVLSIMKFLAGVSKNVLTKGE